MRSALRLVLLALFLFAKVCTASDGSTGMEVSDVTKSEVVTTTTTAASQSQPGAQEIQLNTDERGKIQIEDAADSGDKEEEKRETAEKDAEKDGQAPEEKTGSGAEEQDLSDPSSEADVSLDGADKNQRQNTQEDLQAQASTGATTTTTTENKQQTDGKGTLTAGAQLSLTQGQDPTQIDLAGTNSGTQGQNLPSRGSQLQASLPQKVNNTNLAAPVPLPQPPIKVQDSEGNVRTVSEPQGTVAGQTGASSTSASSKAITGALNKDLRPINQPNRQGEDHSNGEREGTIKGGVNPQQVAAPITTTTKANKPSTKLPDTITGEVIAPALQGQDSSKTSTGVQNPITPIIPADPTEDKKQIGGKATTTTTKPATVNTESGAALTTATITTKKQTASAETSPTPTVVPTTTLPKGFKIPQSLDKMDSSSSISLLFAFATFVTFIVITVAPVY